MRQRPFVAIEKREGETPLQALERCRGERPRLLDVPLTYAGRLDPMASGRLLILIGDECKRRKTYDALDKEYEFEVLLEIASDTGDILGLAREGEMHTVTAPMARQAARTLLGAHSLPYPIYSSKAVDGKPLFQHAHDGTLGDIVLPETKMSVYALRFTGMRTIDDAALLSDIERRIGYLETTETGRVGSDFRKGVIMEKWRDLLHDTQRVYTILSFRTTVSSGTYIRALAPLIAEKLGTIGLAYSIRRTRIGRYHPLYKNLGYWSRQY